MAIKKSKGKGAILAGALALGTAATGVSQVSAAGPFDQYQNYQQNYMKTQGGNYDEFGVNNTSGRLLNRLQNNDIDVQSNKASSVMNKIRNTLGNNLRIKGKFGAPDEFVRVVDTAQNISRRDNLADEFSFAIHARGKQLIVGAVRVKDNQQYSNVRYNFYTWESNKDLRNNVTLNQLRETLNDFFTGTGYQFNSNFDLTVTTNVNQMFAERQYGFNKGANYGYSQAYNQALNVLMYNQIYNQMMANTWMQYQNMMFQNMRNQNGWQSQNMYGQNNWQTQDIYGQNNQQQELKANSIINGDTYIDSAWEHDKFLVTKDGKELRILGHAGNQLVYDVETDKFREITDRSLDWKTAEPDSDKPFGNPGEFFRGLIDILQADGRLTRSGRITGENQFKDKDGVNASFEIKNGGTQVSILSQGNAIVYDCQKDKFYSAEKGQEQTDLEDWGNNFVRAKFGQLIKLLRNQGKLK